VAPASHLHGPPRPQARVALIASGVVVGAAMLAIGGAYVGPKIDPALSGSSASPTTSAFDPAPGAAEPPGIPAGGTSTTPKLTMGQPLGDGETGFQVHGSGFPPHTLVVLSLEGHGSTPPKYEPLTDPKGTFNYTIDQGHVFFAGGIPEGFYHVVATDANGKQARAVFRVTAPPPRPPNATPPQALGPSPGHVAGSSAVKS
jgi:hypothetical protein